MYKIPLLIILALSFVWSSSARFATFAATGTDGVRYHWNNDCWAGTAGPQTIEVNNNNDWGVVSSQVFNTEFWVETYPHIGWYGGKRLSSYPALAATYAETGPGHSSVLKWEAAFDIWLNASSPGADNGYEVMVWNDVSGGVKPGGHSLASVTIGGVRYLLYQGAGNNGPGATWLVRTSNVQSGSVNLKAILAFIIAWRGRFPLRANPVVSTVEYGWEIWGTGGRPVRFHVSRYTMSF